MARRLKVAREADTPARDGPSLICLQLVTDLHASKSSTSSRPIFCAWREEAHSTDVVWIIAVPIGDAN